MQCLWIRLFAFMVVLASPAMADTRAALFQGARAPLLPLPTAPARSASAGSLFSGERVGLFAPVAAAPLPTVGSRHGSTEIARLLDLIAKAEAGRKGYDAVQYGARVKTPRSPTQMTIQDIYTWISDTPRQPHAIGRYQFIPKTLRRLVKAEKLPLTTRFSTDVQDRLALRLLNEAGLRRFQAGDLPRAAFMNNLAKIWAGLPTSSGRSHYHGFAGNKATMKRDYFDRQMRSIFGEG
jgi:muramidase (phage lysozyme)